MNDLASQTEYFDWLCRKVPCDFGSKSYRKLLKQLYLEEFIYDNDMDENRAIQGVCLRQEYADEKLYDDYWMAEFPCSVLEMMVALAEIIESRIMHDEEKGDRTGKWFWEMISSIGLLRMDDNHFKEKVVHDKVQDMLKKNYQPNGRGGLFTVSNITVDIRNYDIWYQAQFYLAECLHQEPLQFVKKEY